MLALVGQLGPWGHWVVASGAHTTPLWAHATTQVDAIVSAWGGGCRGFRAPTEVGSLQRMVTPPGWQPLGRNASMTGQHVRLVMARPDQPDVGP